MRDGKPNFSPPRLMPWRGHIIMWVAVRAKLAKKASIRGRRGRGDRGLGNQMKPGGKFHVGACAAVRGRAQGACPISEPGRGRALRSLRLAGFLFAVGIGSLTAAAKAWGGSPASLPSAARLRAGTVVQLTSDGGHYVQPVWSPDGRWIAFSRAGFGSIEVMRADGTGRRTLVNAPRAGYRFAWSPDGEAIAFLTVAETEQGRRHRVQIVDLESGRVQTISESAEELSWPQWELTGTEQRLVWMVFGQAGAAGWRRDAGPPRPLRHGFAPAPTTKTNALAFYRDGQVWIWDAPKQAARRLSRERGLNPVVSPDGRRIVFSEINTLVVANADGTELRELARGHHPAWSPDGLKVVFDVAQDDGHRITSSDLWVIQADGTELTPLTQTPEALETEPNWSPDGRRIVYRLEDTGQICVLQLEW
jgi:dipeptidyl aminopeptidase/acylaminoacyl peptidase